MDLKDKILLRKRSVIKNMCQITHLSDRSFSGCIANTIAMLNAYSLSPQFSS